MITFDGFTLSTEKGHVVNHEWNPFNGWDNVSADGRLAIEGCDEAVAFIQHKIKTSLPRHVYAVLSIIGRCPYPVTVVIPFYRHSEKGVLQQRGAYYASKEEEGTEHSQVCWITDAYPRWTMDNQGMHRHHVKATVKAKRRILAFLNR